MEPTMSQFANVEDCLEARVTYYMKQRDELLESLKKLNYSASENSPNAKIVREAISKAEGLTR